MLCTRPSLLTKVTLCPTAMVTVDGVTRPLAMVIVAPLGPGLPVPTPAPPPEGPVGDPPPPHAANMTSDVAATAVPARSLLNPITRNLLECRVRRTCATG